jgi:hypothetical protein
MNRDGSSARAVRRLVTLLAVAATAFTVLPAGTAAAATAPKVSFADSSVVEGDAGNRVVQVTVSLSMPVSTATRVQWATDNGTATSADYRPKIGRSTIKAGKLEKRVRVPVHGDFAFEADETFKVSILTLTTGSGVVVGRRTGTVTILDDDAPPAPAAPVLSSTSPPSPNDVTQATVFGSAAAGTTVRLYVDTPCTGSPNAMGTAAELAGGINVTFGVGSHTIRATASNAGGTSPCSNTLLFEALEPIDAEILDITAWPSSDATPTITGTATAGSTVEIIAIDPESPFCNIGTTLATGTATELAAGIELTTPVDEGVTIIGIAVELGPSIGCASPVAYLYVAPVVTTSDTEPNGSVATAQAMATRAASGGRVAAIDGGGSAGDEDFFSVTLGPQEGIVVQLFNDNGSGCGVAVPDLVDATNQSLVFEPGPGCAPGALGYFNNGPAGETVYLRISHPVGAGYRALVMVYEGV